MPRPIRRAGSNPMLLIPLVLLCVLASQAVRAAAPEEIREPTSGVVLVKIKGGCFTRGGPQSARTELAKITPPDEFITRYSHESPPAQVCVGGFHMAKTEITNAQYQAVMGATNPPLDANNADLPRIFIDWNDAVQFTEKLTALAKNKHYRLPTEAEWEYACLAGAEGPFGFGDSLEPDHANYRSHYAWKNATTAQPANRLLPVGSKKANPFGLFDMHGNAAEWVRDAYAPYTAHPDAGQPIENPYFYAGEFRVIKGGDFTGEPRNIRCAARNSAVQNYVNVRLGFRIVLVP